MIVLFKKIHDLKILCFAKTQKDKENVFLVNSESDVYSVEHVISSVLRTSCNH